MKNRIKDVLYIFCVLLSFFMLGSYTAATFKYDDPVEPYRFIMAGIIGILCLQSFLSNYRKNEKQN